MNAKYRIKKLEGGWSNWRDISEPLIEERILAAQITENITEIEYQQFCKQLNKNDYVLTFNRENGDPKFVYEIKRNYK